MVVRRSFQCLKLMREHHLLDPTSTLTINKKMTGTTMKMDKVCEIVISSIKYFLFPPGYIVGLHFPTSLKLDGAIYLDKSMKFQCK